MFSVAVIRFIIITCIIYEIIKCQHLLFDYLRLNIQLINQQLVGGKCVCILNAKDLKSATVVSLQRLKVVCWLIT